MPAVHSHIHEATGAEMIVDEATRYWRGGAWQEEGICLNCREGRVEWYTCGYCIAEGYLYVLEGKRRAEIMANPAPLAWMAQFLVLHLQREPNPQGYQEHFAPLVDSMLADESPTYPNH
jgi:hypothetical protein